MSKKEEIHILDFKLFVDMIKSATKIIESAKISFSPNGVEIYGCRGSQTRCELMSNAVYSDNDISVVIQKLDTFYKVLQTILDVHQDDFTDFKFIVDLPKVSFESKKFKTKFQTQNETLDVIKKWFSTKINTILEPSFEFTTTPEMIKRINGHAFIFDKLDDIRVYLETKSTMEKNSIFATLGNKETTLSNEITLKFGIVNSGKLDPEQKLILDLEHLNLFNALPVQEIKIFVPKQFPMLVSKTSISGKNDSFLKINLYNALLKS